MPERKDAGIMSLNVKKLLILQLAYKKKKQRLELLMSITQLLLLTVVVQIIQ